MLMRPPFQFANEATNISGTPSTTPGTAITPGTSNADGAAVQLLPSLAFDVHYLALNVVSTFVNAAATGCLLDILTDPAGGSSWSNFIDDLIAGYVAAANSGFNHTYCFPVYIKAGSSVGARMRCSHSAVNAGARIQAWAYGQPNRPDAWWCGQKVESLGIVAASSEGTPITPGNAGAFSAWTSIGAASAARFGAIQFGLQPDGAVLSTLNYHWEFGFDSVKLPGAPLVWSFTSSTSETQAKGPHMPIFCDIPEGKIIQARGTCSGTGEPHTVAAYGVH